jgi:thiamine biosynthesis lipoprotein
MNPECPAVRRAKPLLGTLVEISVQGKDESLLNMAMDSAFAEIANIHRLMSFHDPDSDVSRINRDAAREPVTVDGHTWKVLRVAEELSRRSGGVFDITTAGRLVQWGYLPGIPSLEGDMSFRDIRLLAGNRVAFEQPVLIDLGGIAKGYAVDCAVEKLKSMGVNSGCVNAGGDMAMFGETPREIHVRHPSAPGSMVPLGTFSNCAIATSATYFSKKDWDGIPVSALVHPASGKPFMEQVSVTITAPSCIIADGLTKVAAMGSHNVEQMLSRYRAKAFMIGEHPHGGWQMVPSNTEAA